MEIKRNKRKSHTLNISLDFQPPIGISAKYQYLCQKPNSTTAMKTKLWIGIFLLGVCLSLPLHAQQTHRKSGWYHLYASPTDSIGQTPIVTLKDCAALELNTDPYGHYTIIGQVKEHLLEHWADETEKAIGRCLAFVFNDTVICCPKVHARIESGNFQVSSSPDRPMDLPSIYRRLRQEKIALIEEQFKGWTKDSTFTQEQQDSIIADLDYWDAQAITHGFE